jgi:hypothetical protein
MLAGFRFAPVTTRLRLVGTMSARRINLISNVGSGNTTAGVKVLVAVAGEAVEVIPAYSASTRYEYAVPEVNPVSVNEVDVVVDTVTHVRPPSEERCTVYVGVPAAVDGAQVTTVEVCDGVTCGAPGVVGGKPAVTAV